MILNVSFRRSSRATRTDGSWQAEKSHSMRQQLMEAAIQCLIDIGYTQTTIEKIANQAGVSRGAMTHHFKSRAEVFDAVAKYIVDQRAAEYKKGIRKVAMPVDGKPRETRGSNFAPARKSADFRVVRLSQAHI